MDAAFSHSSNWRREWWPRLHRPGEAGQFSVNGQRANTNYFSLDGVSANSGVTGSAAPAQFSGGALPSMTAFGGLQNLAALDSVQDVRIETSSFAPDSGRMPGAQGRRKEGAVRGGSDRRPCHH